jgi:subtilisin family serine protease
MLSFYRRFFFCVSINLTILAAVFSALIISQNTFGQLNQTNLRGKLRRPPLAVPNRYIVLFNQKYLESNAIEPVVEGEAQSLTYQYGGRVEHVLSNVFKGYIATMSASQATALSRDPRIALVEQDSIVSISANQTDAVWGLDRIDQRGPTLNAVYSYGTLASNVNVYVIDTGIRATHTEFGGRATADYDPLPDGMNGYDCNGHGTHVAGTIGGSTYGVAKGVRIHSVRVLPCDGNGLVSYVVMGIDWVTANHIKPAVANMSITNSGVSTALNTAVQNSINAGVTYTIAAGNSNLDACNYSPGSVAAALTVGAIYTPDQKAGYSNWGRCVDIWAPGNGIVSASNQSDTGTRIMSGTSMAAPHVAGVAALYLANNPTASPAQVSAAIVNAATSGVITGLDAASPNKLLYSWVDTTAPTIPAGNVVIKKQLIRRIESASTAQFNYNATNLTAQSFTLVPDSQYNDPNVSRFGSTNTITVSEAQMPGWDLKSISCSETAGSGQTNSQNSTVDLANRSAKIIVEPGETVVCTFTSDQISPSAGLSTVSGRVVSRTGRGIMGATLILVDADTGQSYTAVTNTFGWYQFTGLTSGHYYALTLNSSAKLGITSQTQSFTLLNDLTSLNFLATP